MKTAPQPAAPATPHLARPMPGDAVRLAAPYGRNWLPSGAIGILSGPAMGAPTDRPLREYKCCFASNTFRGRLHGGPEYVSCSGGPLPFIDAADLVATDELMEIPVWRWKDGVPGAGRAEPYTLAVPVWEWTPPKE